MPDPTTTNDDPMLRLRYYRETGQPDEAKTYERYLRETGQFRDDSPRAAMSIPKVGADATSALPRNRADVSGDFEVIGRGAAAHALNAAQGIPGMEAFEAGMGALGSKLTDHPMSYGESLATLREQTDKIPAPIRIGERMLVGSRLPFKAGSAKQAAASGAAYGAADQALQADPNAGIGRRAVGAAAGAAVGGATGALLYGGAKAVDKVREPLKLANRVRKATPLDEAAVADAKATAAADIANYGKAAAEAEAAGGTSPGLREQLDHPTVKPFVELVRDSERGQGADDAKLAREAYKLMSRQRRGLKQRMAANGYDAKMDLEADNLDAAMRRLKAAGATSSRAPVRLDVAPEIVNGEQVVRVDAPAASGGEEVPAVMPSFPSAVAEHARMKGNRAAFETAAERTNKIMRGTRTPAKKLGTESPAAWMDQILGMDPEAAQAALGGTLGEAKGQFGYRLPKDASIVGAIKELGGPAQRLNRIAPYVRALDKQAGNTPFAPMDLEQYLRFLGVANAPLANPK